MSMTVLVRDETFANKVVSDLFVKLSSERLTVEELIKSRVEAEWTQRLVSGQAAMLRSERTATEKTLNAKHEITLKTDFQREVAAALVAFENNSYFILVDDKQVEALDEKLIVRPETVVTFLRLTPLKGG